ncbi:MAG: hypothetical protein WC850_00235 [Candidatus Gracilibacteria bacterium]
MEFKGAKLYNLYLGIVSFVSIVAIGINLGIVLTSVGKYVLISDEEYLQFRESYKLENCKNPTYPATEAQIDKGGTTIQTKAITPSAEEIQKCEKKVREDVKYSRGYDLKDMFITSSAWFVVFLIFFIFHYPKFLRIKRED